MPISDLYWRRGNVLRFYVGTVGNVVTGNEIFCSSNYGIYAAIKSTSPSLASNLIIAKLNKKAAIAVESDWVMPLPSGAASSPTQLWSASCARTSMGDISYWSYGYIEQYDYGAGREHSGYIYLAQLNDAELAGVSVRGNVILGAEPGHYWYFFEQTAGGRAQAIT